MRWWIPALSLLLCVISSAPLARRTNSNPAAPDREAPGVDVSVDLQDTATAEEPGNHETLRSKIKNPGGGLGTGLVGSLDGFEGACLEVYFQPDTLRIGGRARLFRRP